MNSFHMVIAISSLVSCLHAASTNDQYNEQARQLYQAGHAVFEKGDYGLAREKWRKALFLDPNNVDARRDLEKVNRMLGSDTNKKLLEMEKKLDERRIGPHKIEIAPTIETLGIQTGVLMAYGHVFRAPYRVERVDKRILVNGVQVLPSLLAERKEKANPWKPSEGSTEDREKLHRMETLRQEAEQIYKKSWFGARRKILALLTQHPDLFSDIQVSDTGAEVSFKPFNSASRYGWGFVSIFSSPEIIDKNERNNREDQKSYIERDLRSGLFVAITSNDQTGAMNDPRGRVNVIMRDAALTRDQRLSQLMDIFNYGTALDVIENYSAIEWATSK